MKIGLISLLLLAFNVCGQTISAVDCEKILDNEPVFMRVPAMELKDSIQTDLDILAECGQLDSIDRTILNDMLGTIAVRMMQEDKEITYGTLLDGIKEFKQMEEYVRIREQLMKGSVDEKVEEK